MLFADYLVQWLEIAKSTVKLTAYASYKELSNSRIIPYFRNLGVTPVSYTHLVDVPTLPRNPYHWFESVILHA